MATDAWQQVRDALISLWHRAHPHRVDNVSSELEELREEVLAARRNDDEQTENALEGMWQVRLQQLVRANPAMGPELKQLLDQVLMPPLGPAEQTRIGNIVTGIASGSSKLNQAGRDQVTIHGDQVNVGRNYKSRRS
jgi:hypothetical protein